MEGEFKANLGVLYGLDPRVGVPSRRMESLEGDFAFLESRISRKGDKNIYDGTKCDREGVFSQCGVGVSQFLSLVQVEAWAATQFQVDTGKV